MSSKSPKSTKPVATPAPGQASVEKPKRLVSTQLGLNFSIGRESRMFRKQCPLIRFGARPVVWNVAVLDLILVDLMNSLLEKVRNEGERRLQPEHLRSFIEQSSLLRHMLGQQAQFMWAAHTSYIHPEVMHSKIRKHTKKTGEADPLQVMSKKELIKQVKAQQRALTKVKAKGSKKPSSAATSADDGAATPKKSNTSGKVAASQKPAKGSSKKVVVKSGASAAATPVSSTKKAPKKKAAATVADTPVTVTSSTKKAPKKKAPAAVTAAESVPDVTSAKPKKLTKKQLAEAAAAAAADADAATADADAAESVSPPASEPSTPVASTKKVNKKTAPVAVAPKKAPKKKITTASVEAQ